MSDSRYILACPDHRLAALDASGVRALHPASLRRGACGLLRCVPLEDGDAIPAEIESCALCAVVPLDGPGGWAERQHTGRWVERVPVGEDPAWTGSEKGVTIPEVDATEAHAIHLTGGLSVCPRVEVDGVMHRLIRYDGTKPAVLSGYATIYAAEVVALAATEVR